MERYTNVTYKIKVPEDISKHAIYFTIVGNNKMFFINCKSMESFQWITSLMSSWSRSIEAGVEIEDIIKDCKEIFDPNGAYIIPGTHINVNSVLHHIALVLELHIGVDNGLNYSTESDDVQA